MVKTRRSQRAEQRKLVAAAAIFGGVLAAVIALSLMIASARRSQLPLDPKTQCPLSGPHSLTAVLIDRTDPISEVTSRDLINRLKEIASDVPKYGALYLYTIDGSEDGVGEPLFYRCNPGDEATVNALSASKRKRLTEKEVG
jgi:hypothetical protein